MNTAIFSGSFNPIHKGHLAIAEYLCLHTSIEEVWFLVSPHNPLKVVGGLLPEAVRLHWVEQAVESYPQFKASDFEFSLPRPSYTIETLRALRTSYPDREFSLIIGGDNWTIIDQWYECDRLLSEFSLWVYPREQQEIVIPKPYQNSVVVVPAPLLDISSTLIRERILKGESVSDLLPQAITQEAVEYFKTLRSF